MHKSILIITGIPNKENMAELQLYTSQIMPIIQQYGGKPLARYKTVAPIMGTESPEMVVVIEFVDADKITEMIHGKEFNGLGELRAKAFTKLNLMVCDEM